MSDHEIATYYSQNSYYPWQRPVWQQLYSNAHKTFPHAVLLSGVKGIGKKQFAFYLARALLCHSPKKHPQTGLIEPCTDNLCRSCQLYSLANHPDCYHLTTVEDKKIIPVDRIRALIQWSVFSSQLGNKKVIIIEPAEAMNINAANSLLKTLEEPVPSTLIILVSHKKQALLATIRSRCRSVDMVLPNKEIALNWLQKQAGITQADLMLSLASGSPLLAVDLSHNGQMDIRDFIIKHILSIPQSGSDPVSVAELLFKQTKVKASSKKAKTTLVITAYDVLYWFDSIVADLARLMQGCDRETLINTDYSEHLQALLKGLYLKKLLQLSATINRAYFDIQRQINVNLLFETLFIDWNNCQK